MFLPVFMSECLYKASLPNLTSNLRFLVKKCGLQFRIKSSTYGNSSDCSLPGLWRAGNGSVQLHRLSELCGSFLSTRYSKAGKSLQSLWDVLRYGKPPVSRQPGADPLHAGICLQPPLPAFPWVFLSALACFRDHLGSSSGISCSHSRKKVKILKYEFWCPGG